MKNKAIDRLKFLPIVVALLSIQVFTSCEKKEPGKTGKQLTRKLVKEDFKDWKVFRGDQRGYQYSGLSQINTENVHLLKPAWTYKVRNVVPPGMQSNPIVIDGLMYFADNEMNVVALNAATGEEVWLFDIDAHTGEDIGGSVRGLTFWEDENGDNDRIFHYVTDRVYAIDAKTGRIIESFGRKGEIDLNENHRVPADDVRGLISMTSPGMVYKNFLIVPVRSGEGNVGISGDMRAWDALTGEFRWVFHTVPMKGEFGYDTWEWEENMMYGGANAWSGITVDEDRGWIFAATGSGAGEFIYGGSRKGDNLFANCVLALDATTGERKWHYQVIRHDIWDYDLPPPPQLVTINYDDGTSRDVVIQTGKHGTIFVLDRDTGEPIFPVVDKPVPSFPGVAGEQPSATQPWPLKPEPIVRTSMYESDITRITPESHAFVLKEFKKHRTGPVFTPASEEGTIVTPGHHGAAEWGGGSYDPETNIAYWNINEEPFIFTLEPIDPDKPAGLTQAEGGGDAAKGKAIYTTNCSFCHGTNREGADGPALVNLRLGSEDIKKTVTKGGNEMPPFPNFSDKDLNDIIAFLKSDGAPTATATAAVDKGVPTWSGERGKHRWSTTTPQYKNITDHFVDHMGFPAIQPPWGQIIAVDMKVGEILWKVPLGEYKELTAMGIPPTGVENFGGLVATSGGLIFVAATIDAKVRAFDKKDGKLLWEFQMEAPGWASPSIYEIDGKQFVVVVSGGGARGRRSPYKYKIGGTVHAFALP